MNKEDNSSASSKSIVGPPATQEPERSGPIVQGTVVRDSTLKWYVADQEDADAIAVPIAEEIAADIPASKDQGPSTPPPDLSQPNFQGALPEPIHEPLNADPGHPPDSLEIMISEGTVQIETDPSAFRPQVHQSDVVENEVTPPPRQTTPPISVDPAWSTVTPPPKLETATVTPPPRSIVSLGAEPGASVLTPPPKLKTPPATEIRAENVATPPPRLNGAASGPVKEPVAVASMPLEQPVTPSPVTTPSVPAHIVDPAEQPPAVVVTTELQPVDSGENLHLPAEGDVAIEWTAPPRILPPSEMGATPEAPIRMAETAEVGEGDFEVMESLEATREGTSASIAPPPVPARPQMAASAPAESKPGEKKTDALPEALSRRPMKKSLKPWYEEVFDEDYLRTLPFMTAQQTLRETAFIKEALSPPAEGEILDIACGYGRHAIEFGQRGFRVTGLDLSLPLLIRAADESQRRGLSINFVHADMREMAYENQFDAAYCVLTSFGYFDEETNLRVASSICRALKPGGRFLVDIINRDYVVSDLPSRVWWEGDGCVVLEEVDFDFHTSRVMIRRSIVFGDGRQVEHEISVRAYSLHELARILRRAGLQVLEVSASLGSKRSFMGAASRQVVLVCERPLT